MTLPEKICRGFTLVELMVTVAVLGIVLTIAVPNFRAFILGGRMTGYTNDLLSDLAYARSEAVKRAANVTVCASSDGTTCTGGDWQGGWVVRDAAGNVLKLRETLEGTTTLTGAATVTFNGNGRMVLPVAAATLTLAPGHPGVDGRQIQIELSGRARSCRPSC